MFYSIWLSKAAIKKKNKNKKYKTFIRKLYFYSWPRSKTALALIYTSITKLPNSPPTLDEKCFLLKQISLSFAVVNVFGIIIIIIIQNTVKERLQAASCCV